VCFLQAALAETTDAVVEAQDKLITTVHGKAKKRRDELLRASEEAKRRAVEVVEVMGELVLNESIPDAQLRNEILWRMPALGQVLVKATSAEMGDNVGQLDASVRGNAGQISLQWQVSARCP
jgi:hypothetical protein